MKARRDHRSKEHLLVRLYHQGLGCFPEMYRREYSDELLYALRMAEHDARARGKWALLQLAWRELRDLLIAIVRVHLQERSKAMKQPGATLPGGPLRGWQLGAVFLPFLAPLLYHLQLWAYANQNMWLVPALGLPVLGLLIVILVAGLARNFPVWALPVLGMLFFFVTFLLNVIAQMVFFTIMLPFTGAWGWSEGMSLAESILQMLGVQLIFLVIAAGVAAGLLRMVPRFLEQVQQEWTLLSFLLYGIAILPIIGIDEFHGTGSYEAASLLVLAAGAGLYLIAPRRWLRFLALLVPAILSPAIMSLGLYQTFPFQYWANPNDPAFRIWEALQPVLFLAPLPFLMTLAALAPRLPWRGERGLGSSQASAAR